jgi:hypothetical protein
MGHLADVVCSDGAAGIAVAPSRKLRFTEHHTFRSVPMRSTRAALDRDDCSSNRHRALAHCWSMIFSENGSPPRIKSGAAFFGIML